MPVTYRSDRRLTVAEFKDLLDRSTLAERRPVDEPLRLQQMLDHAQLLVSAWEGDLLVGVSRALTDFAFCCYLSDLAVDAQYQHRGIGKKLVELTHELAGHQTTLILLAAPRAIDYYPKIGMDHANNCFLLPRTT